MSKTYSVIGYRPADERWDLMKDIWNACRKANVPIPRDVEDYFDGEDPNGKPGMEVYLVNFAGAVKEIHSEGSHSYQVDLSKLPKDIKFVRFEISW